MTAPDPVDARLLALVAEVGRVAVHDLARRAGLDVREVAARLAGLAAGGLPLVVGVECDPVALRYALASWSSGTASGPHPVGPYGGPSGPHPVGPYGGPSGPHPVGPVAPAPQVSAQPAPARPPQQPRTGPNPVGTWGPPGSAAWARGDELLTTTVRTTPARRANGANERRTGAIGDTLQGDGPDGQPLAIRLVEVVDPADFLFTAAGHRLQPGQRSVVVHTEVTNHGTAPFATPPDSHLVLLDADGQPVSKAPVALSSRPPHRVGVRPGETAGGHTVYVLPEPTELAAIRWSPTPDDDRPALTWTLRTE